MLNAPEKIFNGYITHSHARLLCRDAECIGVEGVFILVRDPEEGYRRCPI